MWCFQTICGHWPDWVVCCIANMFSLAFTFLAKTIWLSVHQLLSNGSRHLIRSDDMIETVYSDRGEIIKTKERRLFLLNDVLMCATPNIR